VEKAGGGELGRRKGVKAGESGERGQEKRPLMR